LRQIKLYLHEMRDRMWWPTHEGGWPSPNSNISLFTIRFFEVCFTFFCIYVTYIHISENSKNFYDVFSY